MMISFVCLIYYKPSYFLFWRPQYTQEQVLYTIIISSLYYVSQESLSTALENLKAGTVATFNHLSVLLAFVGYKFFKIILHKKQLLGKTTMQQEAWLNKMTINQKQEITIRHEELLGVLLILVFAVLIMLNIITDEKQSLPKTTKNKEREQQEKHNTSSQSIQKLCRECSLSKQSSRNEDGFSEYDERLSAKYGQRIRGIDYIENVTRTSTRGPKQSD